MTDKYTEKRLASTRIWAANNREYLRSKAAQRRLEKRAESLVANCRTRARRRDLAFDLDGMVADIQGRIDRGLCEVTGAEFDLSPGRKWNSPSIDRIDAKRGYLPDNVRVVCQAMNLAMGDWGEGPVWQMFQSWTAIASLRPKRKPSSKPT